MIFRSWVSPLAVFTCFLAASHLYGQNSPLGKWKTVDDETGKTKSLVEMLGSQMEAPAGRT